MSARLLLRSECSFASLITIFQSDINQRGREVAFRIASEPLHDNNYVEGILFLLEHIQNTSELIPFIVDVHSGLCLARWVFISHNTCIGTAVSV